MANIQFNLNSQALDFFRTANFGNENTVANLGDKGGIKSGGVFKGGNIFRKLGRTTSEKTANNAIRTELLKALGTAFGISGMTAQNGEVRFSREFMDRLESILGRDVFKKSDFGVTGPDGAVTSGKPLTQRRISAILNKAAMVGATSLNKKSVAVYETRLNVIAAKINLAKFEAEMKKLDGMGEAEKLEAKGELINKNPVQYHFFLVKNALSFYKNELPTLLRANPYYDPTYPDDEPKYQMYDAKQKMHVPFDSLINLRTYIQSRCDFLTHVENAAPKMHFLNLKDPVKDTTDYLNTSLSTFVETSINGYLAADGQGKGKEMIESSYDACIEGKSGEIQSYMLDHNLVPQIEGDEASAEQANIAMEVNTAANAVHDETTTLEDCIYKELEKIAADPEKSKGVKEWKDVAETVKKALVGLTRPISIQGENGAIVKATNINGEPDVREVKAEDVDAIGQACMNVLMIFN